MTPPRKVDTARGWMFVESLLAADEAERIEKLSDDELAAEMRAEQGEGKDPSRVPTAEQLLARATARATRAAGGALRLAPAVLTDASDEPPRVANAVPVEPETERRRPRGLVWLLAAALVLGVLLIVAVKAPAIVAFFRGPQIGPDNERIPPPTPHEIADKIRDDAVGHCEQFSWRTCLQKLDEAARLDPAGEREPRVRAMREAYDAAGRRPDAAVKDKPEQDKPGRP